MGNTNTKKLNVDKSELETIIDNIATNFIIKQNFKDMKNLSNEEYCNKLILITSKVFDKFLKKTDTEYLEQKTRYGIEINKLNKDTFYGINIKELKDKMITNKVNKKRICIGIARYYVKIAQLFSAIVSTLNPEYIYYDENGVKRRIGINKKHLIPKNSSISVQRINLCSNRLNALQDRKQDLNATQDKTVIRHNVCGINLNKRSLIDEIGIPDLEKLYYDSYDLNTGKFNKMTEEMRKKYNDDLELFYKAFAGEDIPRVNNELTIKKFSHIPLKSYHTDKKCSENGLYKKQLPIHLKNSLFIQYSDNIKDILNITEINQKKIN